MKIYTKTGDAGDTSLFGGGRVPKDDPRVEACGALDELNAQLGVARAHGLEAGVDGGLEGIQGDLFELGAELCTAAARASRLALPLVGAGRIAELEAAIDAAQLALPELRTFVLPGGSPAAAALHQARTVCRRAERRIVTLASHGPVRDDVIRYVNRLSDLLFVWSRLTNLRASRADVPWRGDDR